MVVAWKYLYEFCAFIVRRSTKGIAAGLGLKKKQENKFYEGREVRVLGYNCHASAKEEEENDIFKNVKALVQKGTGLAISYSRSSFHRSCLHEKQPSNYTKV